MAESPVAKQQTIQQQLQTPKHDQISGTSARTIAVHFYRMTSLLKLSPLLAFCLGLPGNAQIQRTYRVLSSTNCSIVQLTRSGDLIWTNSSATGNYTIERSDSSDFVTWVPITRGSITNPVMSVKVHEWAPPSGMVFIPGGIFTMGDILGDLREIATPVHTVNCDPFFIGRFEVTNEEMVKVLQWALNNGKIRATTNSIENLEGVTQTLLSLNKYNSEIILDKGIFRIRAGRQRHPCTWINWYGSAAFCNYLSESEGLPVMFNLTNWACDFTKHGYRLPTEAEWELAARGGWAGKRFPWGGDDLITHEMANYRSSTNNSYDISPTRGFHPLYAKSLPRTNPVDAFPANPYGLYGMAGNTWEWVYDWSARYLSGHQVNPTGPPSGTYKIFRGGSWFTTAERVTCSERYRSSVPNSTFDDFGFRVVRQYPRPSKGP